MNISILLPAWLRILLNQQKEAPGAGVQLRLLTGRLLSDACGDARKILDGVDALPNDSLSDERARRLVSLQKEALKRLLGLSKKQSVLERKHKSLQSLLGAKEAKEVKSAKRPKDAKEGDARLWRDKLEAIRAMEQKLDETGNGN